MNTEEKRYKLTKEIISNNYTDLTNKLEDAIVHNFRTMETTIPIVRPGDSTVHLLVSADMSVPEFENIMDINVYNTAVSLEYLSKDDDIKPIGCALSKRVNDLLSSNHSIVNHGEVCQVMYCVLECMNSINTTIGKSRFDTDTMNHIISLATESIRMARCRTRQSMENMAYSGLGVWSMVRMIDECYDLQLDSAPMSTSDIEKKIDDLTRFTGALSSLEDRAICEIAEYKSKREQEMHKMADKSFGQSIVDIFFRMLQSKEFVPACPRDDWQKKVSVYFTNMMRICKSIVDSYYEMKEPITHHKLYD